MIDPEPAASLEQRTGHPHIAAEVTRIATCALAPDAVSDGPVVRLADDAICVLAASNPISSRRRNAVTPALTLDAATGIGITVDGAAGVAATEHAQRAAAIHADAARVG